MSWGGYGQTTDLHLQPGHLWFPFNREASRGRDGRDVWGRQKVEPGEISKVRDLTTRGEPAQTNLVQTQEVTAAHGAGHEK